MPFVPDKPKMGFIPDEYQEYQPSPLETGLAAMAPKGLVSSVHGLIEAVPVGMEKGFDEGLETYRRERDQGYKDLESSEATNKRAAMVGGVAPYLPLGAASIPATMAVGGVASGIDSKADLTKITDPEQLKILGRDVGIGTFASGLLGTAGKYAPKSTAAIAGGAMGGELLSPGGGAIPGAAIGLLARGGASPTVRNYLQKKFNNVLLDVPEAVSERYMNNSKKVMGAQPVEGVGQNIANTLGEIKSDIGGLNQKALSSLSQDRTKGVMKVNEAVEILSQFRHPQAKEMADDLMNGYLKRSQTVSPSQGADSMTEIEVHNLKKFLQGLGEWNSALPSADRAQANQAAGQVNRILRGENEAYAGAMTDLSRSIQVRNALAKKFGIKRDLVDPNQLTYSDQTVSAMNDLVRGNKFDRKRILQELKEQGYGDLSEEILDSLAKRTLTGPGASQGSRKVVIGKGLGGTVGAGVGGLLGGPVGAVGGAYTGQAVGGLAGGALDKYGPRVARRMMDVGNTVNSAQSAIGNAISPKLQNTWGPGGRPKASPFLFQPGSQSSSSQVPFKEVADREQEPQRRPQSYTPENVLPKLRGTRFERQMNEAAQRGPDGFGATYYLLSRDPEFRKLIEGDNQ